MIISSLKIYPEPDDREVPDSYTGKEAL